ncbi:hypothetical protein [Comamonas sp. lk]|uniref:hypothetical protein n=1 Tax=Comamonas sp. lk TaxID=2201272 RepID=UPI000EB31A83|nr:hypothetical protein [Comamonas sp. lk]
MAINRYTMIIHPNTMKQIELELGRFCSFKLVVDAEGAKVYEVSAIHEEPLTWESREVLGVVESVRFIEVKSIAQEPLACKPMRAPVLPAAHQGLQRLRTFLKHGWGAR